ncbi:MAG: inositol-3-phosphate synthase [Nitrospirota bacterium]
MKRVGVLFVGALGYIATTVMTGICALKKGLSSRTGMVTDLDLFSVLDLAAPEDFVIGGWDIRPGSPYESASTFFRNNQSIGQDILSAVGDDLKELSSDIFEGTANNCGSAIALLSEKDQTLDCMPLRDQITKLRQDIQRFKATHHLSDVVVLNLASTEPPLELRHCHEHTEAFEECVADNRTEAVRASTLYTYAAIAEGCPYINFTPSNGALLPALVSMAEQHGVPVMGNDGKTGETLVKSALVPLFLYRNLEVLSWEGFNILGNMDGRVLETPENKESKIRTKDQLLGKILGYTPHSRVHINYVPSLDDQKTAWNFVHFKGFLGAKMSFQFIWQGYDSILAAPLVLDLVRLAEYAKRRGEAGLMPHLASFFKAPIGVNEHRLYEQFQMLVHYLNRSSVAGRRFEQDNRPAALSGSAAGAPVN